MLALPAIVLTADSTVENTVANFVVSLWMWAALPGVSGRIEATTNLSGAR